MNRVRKGNRQFRQRVYFVTTFKFKPSCVLIGRGFAEALNGQKLRRKKNT
jgi:hypothetical protein